MNTIQVSLQKADIGNLSVTQMDKTPVLGALKEYWNGTYESMIEHLTAHGVDMSQVNDLSSIEKIIAFANHIFQKLEAMNNKKNGIGQFDFRLAAILKSRYLTKFEIDDLQTLVFDISDFENVKAREAFMEIFKESSSSAFIEFKEVVNDNLLYYTYSRKAFMEDGSRVTVATARERVNLAEDYKSAKDANFVSSKLILEMAEKMAKRGLEQVNFETKIHTPKYNYEKTYSVSEILKFSVMSAEDKETRARAEEIKKQAEKELQEERQLTRTSLEPDSTRAQVASTNAEIRVETNKGFLAKANYNDEDFVDKLFNEYQQKEIEKSKIRLQKARADGDKAYATMKSHLAQGLPLLEALRATKQEYRDEDTIMFASLMLTKDLLGGMNTQAQIADLKAQLVAKDAEVNKVTEALAKKDESIKEYQSATTKKSNELNILKEEYDKNINEMKAQMKKEFSSLKQEFDSKLTEANSIIDDQSKLIDRLKLENKSENSALKQKNAELEAEISKSKNSVDEMKEMKIKQKFLDEKIKELQAELAKKDEMIERIVSGVKVADKSKKEVQYDTRRVNDILKPQ